MKRTSRARWALSGLALLWLAPLLAALVTSLRSIDDIMLNGFWSPPSRLVFGNFIQAWTGARVARYLLNSFIVTLPSLLGMLFLSSLTAYALAHLAFRGRRLVYGLYVAGALLPYQLLILPVFALANRLGLYDSYAALITIHTAFQLGFCTFALRSFLRAVPREVLDAARVDGAGEFRIYWQIALPAILPALAALATLEFTWVFNDYLWAIVLLRSDALRPVTAGLATLRGEYNTDWPVIIAGALLAALPTLAVFVILQRWFIRGFGLNAPRG